jgi:hypothetical protein
MNNEYHDQGTWRDSVERRIGQLGAGLDAARHTDDRHHGELRDLKASIETLRTDLSTQIATSVGGLRADLMALRTARAMQDAPAAAPASSASLDWKLVATIAALLAGALVGIGISVGRSWQLDDTKAIVRTIAP